MATPNDETSQVAKPTSRHQSTAPTSANGPQLPEPDAFMRLLGITPISVGSGTATVSMRLREDMGNIHGTPHGGAIFTLADSALALASNSHGTAAVALDVTITYCRPARLGTVVTARAVEENLTKSTGLYTITVTGEDDKLVATARGTVFRTGKPAATR